jgi:hypothetical protein
MSKARTITKYFIMLVIVAITLFDFGIINYGGKEASISHVLIEWTHEYPSFCFLLGYTFGHLTWRMKTTKIMRDKGIE